VEECEDNEISLSETQPASPKNDSPTPTPTRIRFSGTRWQRKHVRALTAQPILVARTDRSSLEVDTSLEATSSGHRHQVKALIDSGAKFQFLDANFVCDNAIPSIKLPQSILVYNVDSTENQVGAITHVVDASLFLRNHSEHTLFTVTNLGDQQMLLGHDWLVNHNPEIDWVRGEVKFTRCHSHCSECSKQRLAEHSALRAQQQESANLECVRRIFFPSLNHRIQDITDEDEDKDDSDPCKDNAACEGGLEDGDCLFITSYCEELPRTSETICTTLTVSQRIAEGMAKNAPHNEIPVLDLVPSEYHDYDKVFAKESFDSLPKHQLWDHAIEIIPDAKIPNRKLYPLSIEEQAQLDAFLEENLSSGRI
jgi:hypothetical protein